MPIYDMYPYTNLHQFNLDEIISEVEGFKNQLASIQANIDMISQYLQAFTVTDEEIQMDRDTVINGTLTVDEIIGDFNANAASADKLTVNGGALNDPVYFNNGVPTSTGAILAKSITGNAGTADKLKDAFVLKLIGDVTGQVSLDGSGNVNLLTTIVGTTPQEITTIPNDLTINGDLTMLGNISLESGAQIDGNYFTGTAETANSLAGVNASTTEINYLQNATGNIQSQLDAKQATVTGAASSVVSNNLTASRVAVSDANGKLAASGVTATQLNTLSTITSNVQTQLNGKQSKVLSGTSDPASSLGSVGDLYIKYSS